MKSTESYQPPFEDLFAHLGFLLVLSLDEIKFQVIKRNAGLQLVYLQPIELPILSMLKHHLHLLLKLLRFKGITTD